MAVFTRVSDTQVSDWLANYSAGSLEALHGIPTGVENSNYFVTTSAGEFVLTIFEVLKSDELPFYLNFMAHLAIHGIPCPLPIANQQNAYVSEIAGKPASLVTRLKGKSIMAPQATHCARVGAMLASMHLAAKTYPPSMPNPRGPTWQRMAAQRVKPFLDAGEWSLLESELQYQAAQRPLGLPGGVVHADLFRDNVLFELDHVGGVIDFYFAGADDWLFDLAVVVNDWCMSAPDAFDPDRLDALTRAYARVRALSAAEQAAWSLMLRAGALRFWLSRLYDLHLPRKGELLRPHDPTRFRAVLEAHRANPPPWPGSMP